MLFGISLWWFVVKGFIFGSIVFVFYIFILWNIFVSCFVIISKFYFKNIEGMFMYVDSVWCLFFIYVYEYELDGVVMNYI